MMARGAALVLALAVGLGAVAAQNSPVCQTYVVQSGDSISTIASQFGTTPAELEAALQLCVKGYTPGTFLQPGQKICLPGWVDQCAYVQSAGGDLNCQYYTVQSGDTFDTIAQYFNIPRASIVAANPDLNPATLAVNSFVRLPPYADTCPAPGDNKQCRYYVAQLGDSLSQIATAFSIDLADLQAANPTAAGSTGDGTTALQPGQQIKLPPFPDTCGAGVVTPKPSSCKVYVVKDGDTLSGIAAMFSTSTSELVTLNPSLAAGILSPNTQVILPPSDPNNCSNPVIVTGTPSPPRPPLPAPVVVPPPPRPSPPAAKPPAATPASPPNSPPPVSFKPPPLASSPKGPPPVSFEPPPLASPPAGTPPPPLQPPAPGPTPIAAASPAPVGAIVGGVLGGLALAAVLAAVLLWPRKGLLHRHRAAQGTVPDAKQGNQRGKGMSASLAGTEFSKDSLIKHPLHSSLGPDTPLGPADVATLSSSVHSGVFDSMLFQIQSFVATHQSATGAAQDAGSGSGQASARSNSGMLSPEFERFVFEWKDIQIVRPCGSGSFGVVYLASWRFTPIAVKVLLNPARSAGQSPLDLPQQMLKRLEEEAGVMARMRHPNIVAFIGVCVVPPCVLTEYCSRGSVYSLLRDPQMAAHLTWRLRLNMSLDAARGMAYLHAHSPPIIHRDVKSPNLLVDEAWRVKVSDFNLSRILEGDQPLSSSSATTGGANNPLWLAPEIFGGNKAIAASDVYAFGMVLFELLTWQLPWAGIPPYRVPVLVNAGQRPDIPPREELPGPESASWQGLDAYCQLMSDCWAQDPAARPSFDAILPRLAELAGLVD